MKGPYKLQDMITSRYRIDGFVGEGGMQYVYKAKDLLLDRDVALKTPKNPSAEKRFHRSAVVSAKVNHPNVAKTLDYIEERGKYYLIEELILGKDLAKSLLDQAYYLDPFLVARIFHHLAKGIAASHHMNVVHRDLKPTNIMVVGSFQLKEIKITDFGIAKMANTEITDAVEGGEDSISASATAVGALPYMSPEAIETPREVGLETDIWSLGAMMYELLTGSRPFGSGLKAVGKIITAKYDAFPPFIVNNPQFRHLSIQLIEIISSCLVLDPKMRPTADQIVQKCSELCYPIADRYIGTLEIPRNSYFGFIQQPSGPNVFYHNNCIYGDKPIAGERVMFSCYTGGGANRALPVVRIK
jgi:serine/threonine protein kinase